MSKAFSVTLHSANVKNHGHLYLSLQNLTDSSQTVQVRGRHVEGQLVFSPENQHIQLAPRATTEVSIGVSVLNRRVWQPADYDFDIIVGTTEVQDQLRGHLSVAPTPMFWLMLITVLFALLVGVIVGAFFTLEQRVAKNQALMGELLDIQQQQITAVAELSNVPSLLPTESVQPTQPTVSLSTPTETPVAVVTITQVTATATQTPTATLVPTVDLLATVVGALSIPLDENKDQPIELLADGVTRSEFKIDIQRPPLNGVLEPRDNGPYIYRPNPSYFGTDNFTYQVCLVVEPSSCVTNTVTLNIRGINSPPEADDDQITVQENSGIQTLTGLLLDGDIDADKDILKIEGVLSNSPRVVFIPATANSASSVQYEAGDFYNYLTEGESDSETFQYTIVDPAGERSIGNVTVTIEGVNDPPTANDDLVATNGGIILPAEGVSDFPVSLLLANDTDPDTSDLGQLSLNTVENDFTGGTVVQIDGVWRFDPKGAYLSLGENETAVETIVYTIIDPKGRVSQPATAQLTIQGVNDRPELALITENPLTISPVASPTVTSTSMITASIVSGAVITDVDSTKFGRLFIRYAGNFKRPDSSDEYVTVTFDGQEFVSDNADGAIDISADFSGETLVEVLKSARYVNMATSPAADCRRIDFQIFDEFGAESNIVSLLLEVGGSSCQTTDLIEGKMARSDFYKRGIS